MASNIRIESTSSQHKLIIATKESHQQPSKYELPPPLPNEERRGVVLPDGKINWSCPCLGGLPYGPCGFQFREFFECIHKLKDEEELDSSSVQAQECFPKFAAMKECFKSFPKLYPDDDDDKNVENIIKDTEQKGD